MHPRPLLQRLDPSSVAVFRVQDLGGMLCAVPALRALRAALPRAHVALIGRPEARQFAQRFDSYVDEFIAFPGHPLLPGQPVRHDALAAFHAGMCARRFALALQLHGSGDAANDVVAGLGAHAMAGFCRGAAVVRDRTVLFPCPDAGAEPERLLWLMDRLGAPASGTHLEFPLSQQDEDAWRASGLAAALVPGNYLCIHLGAHARDASRDAYLRTAPSSASLSATSSDAVPPPLPAAQPATRFAALFAEAGDRLADEFGLQVVLTGCADNTDNAGLTAAVAARMRHAPLDAGGLLPSGALAVLLRGARLLLCNDTDVSHIAAGLGLDSVVVFSHADIARWAPPDRHRHRCIWDPAGERVHVVLHHARALLSGTVPSRQRSVGMWPYW